MDHRAGLWLILVSATALSLFGCRQHSRGTVVVTVLRDGQSSFLKLHEHQLLVFQSNEPRTSQGKLIVVQSVFPTQAQFQQMLADESVVGLYNLNARGRD